MNLKKIFKTIKSNYIISIFVGIVILVGILSGYKYFYTKSSYVYVKVKLSQGLWWANTAKPNVWFVNSLKKNQKEYDILGNPIAEVLNVKYFPTFGGNQFDIYLTLKVKANHNNRTNEYTFKRSTLSVAAPIDLQLNSTTVSGTVIELSETPFQDKYVEKIVYLSNPNYSKDFPYLYNKITIGDKFFDGENYDFEVLDKSLQKKILSIPNNLTGQIYEQEVDTIQNIFVKAKMRLKVKNNQLYFGEEYRVTTNATIPISTPNYIFDGYSIIDVQ